MEIKTLAVRQPYASFLLGGMKTEEYRTWKTDYRGDIMIVSSLKPELGFKKSELPCGYALGVVELTDITYNEEENDYSWHISKPRYFPEPIPVKGKLNLYKSEIPEDLFKSLKKAPDETNEEEDSLIDIWENLGLCQYNDNYSEE